MFFIVGLYPKRKELEYYKPTICSYCSKYGGYEVVMEYSVLSLFFIPLFKFNKKYYVRTRCCNNIYSITNKEKASMLEKGQGQNVTLNDYDLELIHKGLGYSNTCQNCNYQISEEHNYCPNCGNPISNSGI